MDPLIEMDEAKEQKPQLCLEGRQLALVKIDSAKIGQAFNLSAQAVVTKIEVENGPDGLPRNCVCFDLYDISMQGEQADPFQTIRGAYPSASR